MGLEENLRVLTGGVPDQRDPDFDVPLSVGGAAGGSDDHNGCQRDVQRFGLGVGRRAPFKRAFKDPPLDAARASAPGGVAICEMQSTAGDAAHGERGFGAGLRRGRPEASASRVPGLNPGPEACESMLGTGVFLSPVFQGAVQAVLPAVDDKIRIESALGIRWWRRHGQLDQLAGRQAAKQSEQTRPAADSARP